jgi:hypothetical protein
MNKIRKITGLVIVAILIIVIGWGSKSFFVDSTSEQSESYPLAATILDLIEPTSIPASEPSQDINVTSTPKDEPRANSAVEEVNQAVDPKSLSTNSEIQQEATPSKPSFEKLKSEADAKILDLRNKAQSELMELVFQYQSVTEVKEKASFIAKGKRQMNGYDARFAMILSAFQAQLIKYDYNMAIIATYQQQYNQEKQMAQAFLGS